METKPLKVTEAMVGNKVAVKDRILQNRPISLLSRDLLNFPKTSDLLTKMEACRVDKEWVDKEWVVKTASKKVVPTANLL